jgi:hypothetical protein
MQPISRALLAAAPAKEPSEFRIFSRGVNKTSKGDFTFDAEAAKLVMAAYKLQGVDMIVDREHDSLSEDARVARSNAGDALAHFKLTLRNGELWATNVAWNSEGASDLANKTRRYTSPAFLHDAEGRITELLNVALVSMPATYGNAPLIAAGKLGKHNSETITARFARMQAILFRAHAHKLGFAPGSLLRVYASRALAGASSDARAQLESVLGLGPNADLAAVIAAVQAVYASEPAGGNDAPPAKAPSAPPAPAPAKELSRAESEGCKRLGIDRAELERRKLNVMRRTPEKKESKVK